MSFFCQRFFCALLSVLYVSLYYSPFAPLYCQFYLYRFIVSSLRRFIVSSICIALLFPLCVALLSVLFVSLYCSLLKSFHCQSYLVIICSFYRCTILKVSQGRHLTPSSTQIQPLRRSFQYCYVPPPAMPVSTRRSRHISSPLPQTIINTAKQARSALRLKS